jgi:hypothetical protein
MYDCFRKTKFSRVFFYFFNKNKKSATLMALRKNVYSNQLTLPKRPLDHFFPTWFFAVHQNAGTINFAGKPCSKDKS